MSDQGVEYFLTAVDEGGVSRRLPAEGYFSLSIFTRVGVGIIFGSGGEGATDYRFFSVPYDLDDKSPQAVIEDDLGPYDEAVWRFFVPRVEGSTIELVEYPNTLSFEPGKVFLLTVGKVSGCAPVALCKRRRWRWSSEAFFHP